MERISKTLIFCILSTGILYTVNAQQGTINIKQDERIDKLLDVYKSVNSKSDFYQIQVGFGSYEKAQELKSQVDVDFPNLYSKIEFESPTYRVRLGRFKTKLEAERKFLEVRKKYPNAMLLKPDKGSR
ncbi:MAG: translation initiation factor IF-2 [Muricauda sp.]|nr:SPOR domain-containing protein [Allomuricauda sp.]MAU25864.1 translation initiation factor IF-2 [Allomuricauda sp.]MBC31899.1 translation initiation factor IF-2 [Allomuricauda sp.]|tara:strand:- start:829 stop:1212 length:384 start_codon:yes stop_codon:yes gene_type:complete